MDKKEIENKRKNKLRYKKHMRKDSNETKEVNKTAKKKIVEDALPSNWTKYEIIEQSDEETCEGANFTTLLDEPLSQGSYFKFKNEENWSNNIEFHTQFQKYFTVDINLLNVGIACVPFTKRHGYDLPVLSSLNEDLEKNLLKYQNYLNKRYPQSKIIHVKKTEEESNPVVPSKELKFEDKPMEDNLESKSMLPEININSNKINISNSKVITKIETSNRVDEDIDSLLKPEKLEESTVKVFIDEDPLMETPTTIKNVISNTTEDLEQWLDYILDD